MFRKICVLAVSLIIIAVLAPVSAFSAGFDCKKAKTFIEKAICSDEELSALDEALAQEYRDTMSRSLKSDAVKKQQLNWMKNTRDKCQNVECLKAAYRKRIAELSNIEKENSGFDITGKYKYIEGDSKGYMTVEGGGKWFTIKFETVFIPRQEGCSFEAVGGDLDENGNPTYGESEEGMKFNIKFKKGLADVKEITSPETNRSGCGMTGFFEGKYVKIE